MPFPEALVRLIRARGEHSEADHHQHQAAGVDLAFLLSRRATVSQQLDDLWNSGQLQLLLKQDEPPLLQFIEASLELFVLSSLGNPSTLQVGLICHYLETYFEELQQEPSKAQLLPSAAVGVAVEQALCLRSPRFRASFHLSAASGRGSGRGFSSHPRSEDDVVSELLLER